MATRGAKIISDSDKEQILRNSKDVQEHGIQYATSTSWDDLSEEDMIAVIHWQGLSSLGESKATEVNYDYNEIKGGGTWVEYHGYDGRTGKPDGSIKKGKAWLKGPAGWVVGDGVTKSDFVDESNFISSESKANEIIEDLSDVDSLDLHGSLEDGKNWDSGWHWNCDYCSGIDLGSGFGEEQIRIIQKHLRDEHGLGTILESEAKELSSKIEDMKYDEEPMRFGDGHGILADPLYPESEKSNEFEFGGYSIKCDKCDGRGKIWTTFSDYDDYKSGGYTKDIECPDCKGTGKIEMTSYIPDKISESSPDEVWCDLNNQWEDETSHKDHIKKQFGEKEIFGEVSDVITGNPKVDGLGRLKPVRHPKKGERGFISLGSGIGSGKTVTVINNLQDGWVTVEFEDGTTDTFPRDRVEASEYGDPLIGSWDEGGWFFGIPNMTRDDYEGSVYWKGVKVEHYDHDYFGRNDDNDNWVNKMRQDAKELERKILELEAKNIPVNMSSVLASYESKANEVDNSMDLGLLSGGIPEVDVSNNEQCEICGQLIDQNLMDYHVEQEHGLHVPSQYTQDTISQSMGDPNYDHLEDWRTSYGESKKIANEGSFNDAMNMLMWVNYDSDEEMYEAVAEYTGMDYEKVKKRMEAEQRALDTESKANEVEPDLAGCPFCKSNNIEEVEPYGWTAQWVCNNCGKVFGELDYMPEPPEPTPEELEDDRLADAWLNDTDPNKVPSEKEIFGESKATEANPPPEELGYRLQNEDDGRSRDPDFEENPMNIGGDGFAQIVIENDGVDWVWNRDYGMWEQSEFTESEGADEPEYYDDIPEEKLPTDFELEDVKEEDVVVESSEDDYEWEEDYKKFGDYDDNDDPDDEYIDGSDVPKHGHYESNAGTSKAEEAFNKGASAEEIYTLVDTKESEDGRTQSEDDYLNNLYNKTTANRSAGFTDLS